MKSKTLKFLPGAFSWSMYDWANSSFAVTIMSGFFPIFFSSYWSVNTEGTESTFWLGVSLSVSGLIVAVMAPIMGAIGDRSSARKSLLLIFAFIGICATGGLYFVAKGNWQGAALLYVLAMVSWLNANSLYDSLIVNVASEENVDFLSGFGFAVGYLGGGLLFAFNVVMVLNPALFNLIDPTAQRLASDFESVLPTDLAAFKAAVATLGDSFAAYKASVARATEISASLLTPLRDALSSAKAVGVQISFLTVAVWWALFALPLLFFVKEKKATESISLSTAIRDGFSNFFKTAREIMGMRNLMLFLLAYWLYIDGVDTVISMAVDYGKKIGFKTSDLITALLLVQFVGFPFAILFGFLGQKFGPKPMILFSIVVYLFVTTFAYNIDDKPVAILGKNIPKFFILAFMIGLVQGCIQSMSRSLYARLVPEEKAGSYFGFYNMLGKFATIFGPMIIAIVTKTTGNQRLGFVSISVLFLLGGFILLKVKVPKSAAA